MATWWAPQWAPWLLYQWTNVVIGREPRRTGVLCLWVEADGGRRGAQNQFDKRFNHMDECWARRTLLAVSFTHRHTDWLICSLTHLVNWYVSHFKSYIHNDMFCISHYSCLRGSNVRGERSKQSVCRVGSCVTSKLSAPAIYVCANSPQNAAGRQIHNSLMVKFMITVFCRLPVLILCSLLKPEDFVWGTVCCQFPGIIGCFNVEGWSRLVFLLNVYRSEGLLVINSM